MRRPEHELQKACVVWLELMRRMGKLSYFAVPNGGKRGKREAWRLKEGGVRAGVPDLVLCFKGGATIFVELKAKNGYLSPIQKMFHEELRLMGFQVHTVRDLTELMNIYNQKENRL